MREIGIIVLIIVLLFGATRIPELMRSIGTGFREFKKGIQGEGDNRGEKRKKPDQVEKGD
jgi:sec-independent protein translocase protein TatA